MSYTEITFNEILDRIKQTRRRETLYLLLKGLLNTLLITLPVILLVSIIEMIGNGDSIFRGTLFGIILISLVIPALYYTLPMVLKIQRFKDSKIQRYPIFPKYWISKPHTIESIALRIGNAYPDIKDNLCNVIQLISTIKNPRGTSPELAMAAFDNVSINAKDRDFDVIIDKNEIKRILLYFLIAFSITFGALGLFNKSLGGAFYRVLNFNQSFLPPAPFSLMLETQNIFVIRGEKTLITIKAKGKAPETVNLHIKEEQQENYDEYTLRLDSGNIYHYEIPAIKQSLIFYADAFWFNSLVSTEIGKIKVIDRPVIRSMTGRLIFPSYTRLAPKNFDEQSGDLAALKGSQVDIQILANKDLKSAVIELLQNKTQDTKQKTQDTRRKTQDRSQKINKNVDTTISTLIYDTTRVQMNIDGRKGYGSFRITSSGQYRIVIYDKEGEQNEKPIEYDIIALTDAYPSISLLMPTFDVQLSEQAILPIKVAISDDYGFSSLKLHYRLVFSRYTVPDEKFASFDIPIPKNELTLEVPYIWDLKKLDMSPEDRYEYYLEISDNDIVSGPKSSKTQTMTVRLPSLDEVLKDADHAQNKIQKDLEKVLKDAEDINKDMKDLNKELLKNNNKKDLDWKEKKKAEDIKNKQAELEQKLSTIQNNMADLTKQLQENKVLSPETLQKYLELQKLMQEVNSPELEKLQQKMEEAMKNLTPDQVQKAMEKFKFDEERFRKSIERTLKILKRLQAEQKVDALTKRAEELKNKQDEINKQTENANPNDKQKQDELSKQQAEAKKELENIKKDLNDLDKLFKEIGKDMPQDMLDKASQELNPDETMDEMDQSQKQCSNGQMNKAKDNQKKAGKKLKNFADNMKKVKEEMEKRSQKEAMRQMQKAINDLTKLSEMQEDLKDNTQSTDYGSTQIPDLAEMQAEQYSALANVANSLMELSEKTFAVTPQMGKDLGNALQQMQKAIQELSERRTSPAAKAQEGAMSALNESISGMQSMMNQMKNQGNGSCDNPGGTGQGKSGNGMSFGEQLQQMAAQQQGMNNSLQQLAKNQGKLSSEQQSSLRRLTEQQGNAGKTLEQLAKEQKENNGAGGEKKAIGDLEKIAQEMKEVVTDLQSGQIRPETINKQERILSRLLDATRSINDRDYEKQRESRAGTDFNQKSPGEIDLKSQEGKTRALQELLRSIQQGYTKDYESLIQKYFEALQNKEIDIVQ